MNKLMTKNEFVEYANEVLDDEAIACLQEACDEFSSEVARFGDAGPGAGISIRSRVAFINGIERQLARIERRAPRDFRFRVRYPD